MAQTAGIIENDGNVQAIYVLWCSNELAPTGCRMVITPGSTLQLPAVEPPTPAQELYARGRAVLGAKAGGLITKLLKMHNNVIPLARATIEVASTKTDPAAYVGAVARGPKETSLQAKGEAW